MKNMEYRKQYNTPREHIDNDLLLRVLEERDPVRCNYGTVRSRRNMPEGTCCERAGEARMDMTDIPSTDEESCAKKSCLSGYSLAMAYTPTQEWKGLYNDDDAMQHGTIFSELYKPFYHGCNGSCR